MKVYSTKNCLISLLSLGCMTIVVFLLFGAYVYQRNISKIKNITSYGDNSQTKDPSRTHLEETEGSEVKFKALLMSDSESDIEYIKKALEIGALHDIDVIFHLGDVSHLNAYEDLYEIKQVLDDSGLDYHVVPGDRDLYKKGLQNFNEIFGENYQLVDLKGVKVLLIDNSNEYNVIDDEQWSFIESNINDVSFVVIHNPIYKTGALLGYKGMGEFSDEVEEQRIELLNLIRESDVKAVFTGDRHIFSEDYDSEDKELNHYVVGAINSEKSITPSFVILTVYEDGNYYVEKMLVN